MEIENILRASKWKKGIVRSISGEKSGILYFNEISFNNNSSFEDLGKYSGLFIMKLFYTSFRNRKSQYSSISKSMARWTSKKRRKH